MMETGHAVYLYAAYAVFLGGIGLYVVSLAVRKRNLQREAKAIQRIAEQMREERSNDAATSQPGAVTSGWST